MAGQRGASGVDVSGVDVSGVDVSGVDRARRLIREDWSWVNAWARDPVIDLRLGPIDVEWLEHVLEDDDGVELVIEGDRGDPIALVGCVWDPNGETHVISDIAVCPGQRRSGLGQRALAATLTWVDHPPAFEWAAFVEKENEPARRFFRKMGWSNDGMVRVSRLTDNGGQQPGETVRNARLLRRPNGLGG